MNSLVIVGSERSGGNLLRVLLGNHSKVEAPIPVHFCDVFCDIVPKYGSLSEQSNAVKLLEHMIRYANSEFSDWALRANALEIVELLNVNSFPSAFSAIHMAKAQESGKEMWFCKDNHMHKYAFPLLCEYPGTRFVHLYRDPRDQVASWMRKPLHLLTPRKAIQKWVDEQEEIQKLILAWGLPVYQLSYEQLIQDTKSTLSGLLQWLGLDAEEGCFQTSGENEEASKLQYWENLKKPVISDNFNRFGDILTETDIAIIEKYAGDMMDWLGYHRISKSEVNLKSLGARWHEFKTAKRNKAQVREDRRAGKYSVIESKQAVRRTIINDLSLQNH